jgi:dipeptidyl aminopeptidase/acylaminoacyl peptidase
MNDSKIISLPARSAPISATPSSTLAPILPGTTLRQRMPGDAALSPDGKQVAFTVWERLSDEAKRQGRIWVVDTLIADTGIGEPKPLLKGPKSSSFPRWSPDSKSIVYTAVMGDGEKAKQQLHVMSAEGNQVRQVCTMPNGVSEPVWSPDGKSIAFLSYEGEEAKSDPIVVAPGRHQRLWTIHVDSDRPVPVTPDGLTVWEYAWSPDSKQFALYYSIKPDENGWYAGQIGLVAAGGGAVRQMTHLTMQASSVVWSPDGINLAYISGDWSDRGHGGGDIFTLPVSEEGPNEPRNLTLTLECSPAWCHWLPDNKSLLFAAYTGVTHLIATLGEDGVVTVLDDDFVMAGATLSLSTNARFMATIHSTSHEMYDIWFGEIQEQHVTWHRLSRLNPIIEETFVLGKTERIRYESVDGWQIDALFTHPSVRKTEGPPPLVVNVHGGPSWAWVDDFGLLWTQLLASAGYAVLRPNIRGSWGRGTTFADAVVGDMGGKDFQDVMHGVDYLIEHGLVDGNRMAIVGWSYGGFMTAWAVSQTSRFKAAVMGAGWPDWHDFHALSNLSDWDIRFLKADPLDNPEVYRKWSPNQIVTPTLVLHGEKDTAVPVSGGYAFQRALQERGIPVEFVVYPREGHGISEYAHALDIEERILRWFEKYL